MYLGVERLSVSLDFKVFFGSKYGQRGKDWSNATRAVIFRNTRQHLREAEFVINHGAKEF